MIFANAFQRRGFESMALRGPLAAVRSRRGSAHERVAARDMSFRGAGRPSAPERSRPHAAAAPPLAPDDLRRAIVQRRHRQRVHPMNLSIPPASRRTGCPRRGRRGPAARLAWAAAPATRATLASWSRRRRPAAPPDRHRQGRAAHPAPGERSGHLGPLRRLATASRVLDDVKPAWSDGDLPDATLGKWDGAVNRDDRSRCLRRQAGQSATAASSRGRPARSTVSPLRRTPPQSLIRAGPCCPGRRGGVRAS